MKNICCKKNRIKLKGRQGATMLELILYISVFSIIMVGITLLLATVLEARVKNKTIAEVEQQGAQVCNLIAQTIRNAEGINSPAPGASAATLDMDVINVGDDPTVFSLVGGTIMMDENGTFFDLHSTRATASSLSFENLSKAATPGVIRASFTLTYNTSSSSREFTWSRDFACSASLREP